MYITIVKLYEIYYQIIIDKQPKKLNKKKRTKIQKKYPLSHLPETKFKHPPLRTIYVLANETVFKD